MTKFLFIIMALLLKIDFSFSQVENVPINNQVYEFLDRMGMKGILPLYSNTMLPLSREEVARLLEKVFEKKDKLNNTEREFLEKFRNEFIHEIEPDKENAAVLLHGCAFGDLLSDKEKYLFSYSDSSVYLVAEFIGTLGYRRSSGDTYGSTNYSVEEHGGRIRGTIKNRLGFFLQSTNGTLFGNRALALSDVRLRGNVKLNDLNSSNFDFTEAYLRADLGWFNLQFGREYNLVGTGYSNRLILSSNAPVIDLLKLDFNYKSFRFVSIHGSLVDPYSISNKYLAMHRAQISLFNFMNFGASEMIIYQRSTFDFAYLNPINFYKSSEHSLRDRDNAFLNFDVEIFPINNCKIYGSWLIDDMDFKKMGTGWWGNEFAWQGGTYITDIVSIQNLDGVVEYTRIEPYVYSNRLYGNSYSNNKIGLGHHLEPNSDEWFFQLSFRPSQQLRTLLTYRITRHGENEVRDGVVINNVGGDILQGHRDFDSETIKFLDGNLIRSRSFSMQLTFEPINNLFVNGLYEIRNTEQRNLGLSNKDSFFSFKIYLEF